jgi:hypothetical protein
VSWLAVSMRTELDVSRTRSSSNETKRTLRIFFRCSGGRVVDAIVNLGESASLMGK